MTRFFRSFLLILAMALALESAAAAQQQGRPGQEPEGPILPPKVTAMEEEWLGATMRPEWMLSGMPGFGLLYVHGEHKARSGFAVQALASYAVRHPFSLELRGTLGLYSGDGPDKDHHHVQGIYSQAGVNFGARYTFSDIKPWFEPYATLSLGYLYSELDRETTTMFTTHSMTASAGGGISFKVTKLFWLGTEASLTPVFFGRKDINGSLAFQWLATLEFRL